MCLQKGIGGGYRAVRGERREREGEKEGLKREKIKEGEGKKERERKRTSKRGERRVPSVPIIAPIL